ncbi:unnamed protein product [Victoria cruziana]
MEAETTVSGIGHKKENRKDFSEESAVDKLPEPLLELTSPATKQNQVEKIEGLQPNGSEFFDLVDVSKDIKRISRLDDAKFDINEKLMEEQAVMSTEVQTGENKHFECAEFCETPSKTKVVSIISSDEHGPPECLDLDLKETNEQETYVSTSAIRKIPRMQNPIQKDPKEHGVEISEISADEFPQNAQEQSGDVSNLLTKEKSAARVSFERAEANNLIKSSEPTYSMQNESWIRKNKDQKEERMENISSMSLQQNFTIPINFPDNLEKVEDGTIEAIYAIGQTKDDKPKDMNFSSPGKTVEAIPVEEKHFHKENISSTSENPIPDKHDNRENMDTGDSTFVKNLMLVAQEKCELDESNKEAALTLKKQPPEDTGSVEDEWTQNSTKELKEGQIVETIEDGSNGKKSTGTEYKKICEYLSEEDKVEPVTQGNTTTKEIQLIKETMIEKQKTPFYTENKEERSSPDATGENSEESNYLSSECSGCKDISDLENGKSFLPSDKGTEEESFRSEDVYETHSPSMINSTKELPLKEGKIHETGAETCDSVAKQLKEVVQKLDKEAVDLYLQQTSVDIDLPGEGREKVSENEYVEEDIEMDGVDKRLDENLSQFIKEETISETIGSLSNEENNTNITGAEDKGNLDAVKFSLMSTNQDTIQCMKRVHNDASEEVTEILMPETMGPHNALGVTNFKCASDTIKYDTAKQATFVENSEKSICSALKDYKHGADDMREKEVLTDDGTSQQHSEHNLQKDGIACRAGPSESVSQATSESFHKDILPTKEESVENVTDDNEKDGEMLKGNQDLNDEQALELISLSDEKLQKNLQFSEIEAFCSNENADDDVNEEINVNSLTIKASTGELVVKEKVEAVEFFVLVSNEKALENIPSPPSAGMKEEIVEENERQRGDQDESYATPSEEGTITQKEDVENVKFDDAPPKKANEKQNQTIADSDCGANSQASIDNNMAEGKTSSEVHGEISTFMSEKNDRKIVDERTNNLDNISVQGTIESYADQKGKTVSDQLLKNASSALKECNPEAYNMAKDKALFQQGTSEQATNEANLRKDQTNSGEVSCGLVSRDADGNPEFVSLPARKEIDGNLSQYNEKNDELLERSQNLDAELTLERTSLARTCLEKSQQLSGTELLCKYITSDHKADDESTITSSTFQASIGKKVDKLKQEEPDETVVLVSEEKAPETTLELGSESMEDVATEPNKRQDSNQYTVRTHENSKKLKERDPIHILTYTSSETSSTEETSSQQEKIEIKFHDSPEAATEEQNQSKTDEGCRCEERHLQNEDGNNTFHQSSVTDNSLEGQNIYGYTVSHASVGDLKKDETNCQMHERMSSSISDKKELVNADHKEAAANEATGEEGDIEHRKHQGPIAQADETRIPEVENKHKMIKEATLNSVPEDAESGSLNHSRMHGRLEKKDIPDEICHRGYFETVNKNNKSSTNESKHSDNMNKEIINEVLDQSIPKLQNKQDLDVVKENIEGATGLVPEGKDHESCNEICNVGSENDAVKTKDVTVQLDPVVHVKNEENLVEDNSVQFLVSSEPLPIEMNLHNGMEACETTLISDSIKCENPKELDIKDMTSPDKYDFQAQTEQNMHLIYEHNGKPKDDSETVPKEEESESFLTSTTQSSMDKHGEEGYLEDEMASETGSSASHATQRTEQHKGEDSATVYKSNPEEQQIDSIVTGTFPAEELAGLVTITEAYSSCHEDERVDEERIKIETTGSGIQISQETMEKPTTPSSLDLKDKNPEKMSLIQDIPLVKSMEENHPLLGITQTQASMGIVENEGTDSRICSTTMEKLIEDSNFEIVEIPEDNGSVVQDIPEVEVGKKEDSTKVILKTKDSKKLAEDVVDGSSSTHDSVGEVGQEDMKLEDCSVNDLEKDIPKETTTFEEKPEVEAEKNQDPVVELMHIENTETQIEQVSTNRIHNSNEETSQEHVYKTVETCGLKLQEETLEQAASLIDDPQVETRMQDDSFNLQEERNKVFIRDDMDISTTHEALRVIPQEHLDSSKDFPQLELQMTTPAGEICNIQALEGNRHEYASQNKESSKDLQVISDSIQENMQEEMENPDHQHVEIQTVDLEEPTVAEETRCSETEKQEHAAAEALKEESTQNLVKKGNADLCSFSATVSSAKDIVWQSKENPSKPSNFTFQTEIPEEKTSFEESSQIGNENEEDLAKQKLQKEETGRASSAPREIFLKTLQEHPDLLEEAPSKELRVAPIQGSLQIEEEEECLASNVKVHKNLDHDNHRKEELQPCFKTEIEKGNVYGEKSDMDQEKYVKSPELESEEETSEKIKLSGDIKDQPGGEINMSSIYASKCETEETEKETQGEVLKADPLEQRHQTTTNNGYHANEILTEGFTPDNVQEAQNEKSEKEESKGPAADQVDLGSLSFDKIEEEKTNNLSFLASGELKDEILEASEHREIKTMGTNYKSSEVAGQDLSVVLLKENKQTEEPLPETNDKSSTTVHSPDVFVNQAKFETASLGQTEYEKHIETSLIHEEQNNEILESSNSNKNETVNSTDQNILVEVSGAEISSENKFEAAYQTEHENQNQEMMKVNGKSSDGFKGGANSQPLKQEMTVPSRASEFKMEDQKLHALIPMLDKNIQEPNSLELDNEDKISHTTKHSRNTEKKAQNEAATNLFTVQPSFGAGIKLDKSAYQVQHKVLKADPVEQSLAKIDDNESHDEPSKSMEEKSSQHDTSKSEESEGTALDQVKLELDLPHEKKDTMSVLVFEKPKDESPEASFDGPAQNQAEFGKLQIGSNKIEMGDQSAHAAEEMVEARMGQVRYSDEIKREIGTSLAAKSSEEEMIEEVVSKEDGRRHDNIPNSMSSEQIHILTDAMEQNISKDDQLATLISMTHEKQEKEQNSGNKLQNDLEGVDLTAEEMQNASGTRKSVAIDCQNEKKPSYTEVLPVIQVLIKETLPLELEERSTAISIPVSAEETSELTGANDDTNIRSNITKGKEFTDFQADEDQINTQGMKEDITESQRLMPLPEVAIGKQSSDGVGPSFTKETMKAKNRESNEKRELNIKKQTSGLSEEKTAGLSMGMEGTKPERSKANNHVQLMTMKDEENDNLPFPTETTTESGISTEENKEAVQEVSLPVNEEHARERVEISKKIEIQDFQNDEALHICATQLAAKEVVQIETAKVQEISDLVMKLQHHEEDKINLKYDTPVDDESQNLPSKIQVITQRSGEDEAKDVKSPEANSEAELQSSHGESLDSTISEEKEGSTENLSSFSDIHASSNKNNLRYAKDEVPQRPLLEPEMASCESIYESERSKPCVQDKVDLQEEAVVSTEKEKKDGEQFDSHPDVSTKYVEMVDGNQKLNSRTEVEAEKQYKQSDDQPAGEVKMYSQKANEPREEKLQTKADEVCDEVIEGTQVMDSSSKDIILPKEENKVGQQGLVQKVVEKIEKDDASGDKKPEEIGQTVVHETRSAQKDLEIIDNMSEQAQAMDIGKTTDEKNMKMGEHFMDGKQCAADESSDDKPTPCTELVFTDKSAEEGEAEEHKHEESGFEAAVEEDSLEMKATAVVKDDSPHYKTDTVQIDLVHPEKNAERPDEENKQEESGSVAPVLEESSGTTDCKPAHKKHNILSSVGSKVKHSIGKVKKAISGKSSHPKPHSAKE